MWVKRLVQETFVAWVNSIVAVSSLPEINVIVGGGLGNDTNTFDNVVEAELYNPLNAFNVNE